MRQPANVVNGYYKDPNLHWSAQDCLNWLPISAERAGTETPSQLRDVPGMRPFVGIANGGKIRGGRNVEGKLFVVCGTTLYEISNIGVAIPRGTVPGVGRVSMAHNQNGLGNQLLVVNGSAGYVYHTATQDFAKVTDAGYPGAFVAAYVDSYIAQVEPQGRYWFHSDLADAHVYNTLDQYEAEGQPDRIVTLSVSHREVLVFGKETIEPYVNSPTGDGTAPFVRASNTVIECGCSARYSVRKLDNSDFWLDDKRIVRRLDGYTPIRVSTVGIEAALSECTQSEISAAWATTWEDRGHKVYYLTVPGKFTFGYDVLSGQWHRRSAFGLPHWPVTDIVYWNDRWLALSAGDDKIYALDWDYALDGSEELIREVTTGALSQMRENIFVNYFEPLFDVGGKETVAVEFQAQPAGPTITGDSPDGPIGSVYSFSYTMTAGDSPIESVSVISGDLPPGVGIDNSGNLSGSLPASVDTWDYVIRVVDANGLYDTLSDSITTNLDGAIGIPTVTDELFGISGHSGGNSYEYTDTSFAISPDTTEPWARIFCVAQDTNSLGNPPEMRVLIYTGAALDGTTMFDSEWFGNPAHQVGMEASLAISGLSAWSGTISAADVITYGTYPCHLRASDAFSLPVNFHGYSGRLIGYQEQSSQGKTVYIERPDPAELPAGAVKVEGLPGYYLADGLLYFCDWIATAL